MGKIFVSTIGVLIIHYQRNGGIIGHVDTSFHIGRHCSIFDCCWFECFIFTIGNGDKMIGIYTFFSSISTANNNSNLIYGSFARTKPLSDSRRIFNAPHIAFHQGHFALGNVYGPICGNIQPRSFGNHTRVCIHFASVSIEWWCFGSFKHNGQLFIGISSCGS